MKRKIVIAPYEAHRLLFNSFRKDNPFCDIKFITVDDLVSGLTFSYSLEAIKFVIKKLNVDYDKAISIVKVLALLPEDKVDGYDSLFSLKEELIHNKLFTSNKLFNYELKNSDIEVFYYSKNNPYLKKYLKDYEVIYHHEEVQKPNYKVFANNDDELIYVYNKIEELLISGVPSNKIFVYGLTDEDKAIVDRLNYNYDFNLNGAFKKHFIDLPLIKDLIANFDGLLDKIISSLDKNDENYDDIATFFKDYYVDSISLDLQKEIYLEASRRLVYKTDLFKEAVKVLSKPIIGDDEYLFILNYAQGIIPVLEKDDDFIDDLDKLKLNIPTSEENNVATNEEFCLYLSSKGNITLCYPKKNYANKLMVSPLATRLDQKEDFNISFNSIYSYKEARLEYANLLDIKRKFIYEHPLLNSYASQLFIPYNEYDSSFNGVAHFFPLNVISLSYSSLSSYIRCAYKYYLDYVLQVDKTESNFNMNFGKFSHALLAKVDENSSFDELYDECYQEYEKEFTSRDKIFLKRLKDDLHKTFDFVKEYESHIENGSFIREKKFEVKVCPNIALSGVIDKVIYSGPDQRYVSILDYKSGSETFKEKDVEFGFSLQLPIYSYIFSKHPTFRNNQLIALFIEKILAQDANKFLSDDKYRANLKVFGEYLKDQNALYSLDTSIPPGSASEYFKYLCNVDIDKYPGKQEGHLHENFFFQDLVDESERHLLNVGYSILNNEFNINPKIYKGNNVSCKFCSYRDICFRNLKHFVVLKGEEEDEDGD